mmetsp:Transcript_6068/g.15103  ORF Transcript_6068/g.15103 Transcript_6068/m.15103 type:complete len:80 (-) Transcript_6068:4550-4789(-)
MGSETTVNGGGSSPLLLIRKVCFAAAEENDFDATLGTVNACVGDGKVTIIVMTTATTMTAKAILLLDEDAEEDIIVDLR